MIAVDTNVLVHAHRAESEWHPAAVRTLRGLAEGRRAWTIPWSCAHEFVAVVTNVRLWLRPTPLELALEQVGEWTGSPSFVPVAETEGYWQALAPLALRARARGGRIHDARIAALCVHHRVEELWTADRDFGAFPELRTRNPLVVPARN